jgi:hypothetical protein
LRCGEVLMTPSTCIVCGAATIGRADRQYCGTACKQAAYRRRAGVTSTGPRVTTSDEREATRAGLIAKGCPPHRLDAETAHVERFRDDVRTGRWGR